MIVILTERINNMRKRCPECGRFFNPEKQGDSEDTRCQECIDIANSDDEYYQKKRKES